MKTQYECVFISNWPHDTNCYQCGKSREEHNHGAATLLLDDVQQHSGDGGEIKWNCPHCNFVNTDWLALTAIPMCGGCNKDVEWHAIREMGASGDWSLWNES